MDGQTADFLMAAAGQDEVHRLLDFDCADIAHGETAAVRLGGPYRPVIVDIEPLLQWRLVVEHRSPGAAVEC